MSAARGNVALALVGGFALAAATPPAWFPGAEWLVLLGLGAWFALATRAGAAPWHSYLLGCVHMAMFSWSVRHVLVFAYVLIVVLGGVYFVLASVALRGRSGRALVLRFAVVAAASFWARANMPGIWYPHGQPAHCLYEWPVVLLPVTVVGEALMNALLAAVAAAAVVAWRSWRVAATPWPAARRQLALAIVAWVGLGGIGRAVRPPAPVGEAPVAIAAIEPGFHPQRELAAGRWRERFVERLLLPTRALLAEAAPPELVLWPESSVGDRVARADALAGTARVRSLQGALPASGAHLVLGLNVADDAAEPPANGSGRPAPPTPAAAQLELPSMRVVGHQEKRHLVPGGEFQPYLTLLPTAVSDWLRDAFAAALGSLPDLEPGAELPPLQTPRGVKFGALLCYDNAFPGPAAAQVAMGARFLAVLSNETWYEGGAELQQLMAMTVLRALETATPIVRCTQDGWSGVVEADGRLGAGLPPLVAPTAARILRVELAPGPGRVPPLAWLRAGAGPGLAALAGALLLHALWQWARLRAARTAPRSAVDPGSHRADDGSGS